MTRTVDVGPLRLVTIETEKRRVCQLCGSAEETRPYGPGGIRVCFPCGMADKAETERQFNAVISPGGAA